jgi:hypothetical protein
VARREWIEVLLVQLVLELKQQVLAQEQLELGLEPELKQEQLVRTSAPLVLALRVASVFAQQVVVLVVIQAAVLVQQMEHS